MLIVRTGAIKKSKSIRKNTSKTIKAKFYLNNESY